MFCYSAEPLFSRDELPEEAKLKGHDMAKPVSSAQYTVHEKASAVTPHLCSADEVTHSIQLHLREMSGLWGGRYCSSPSISLLLTFEALIY